MYLDFMRRSAGFAVSRWRHTVKSLADIPGRANVLIVSIPHELAQTQVYPFHFYQQTLAGKYGIDFVEVPLSSVMQEANSGKAAGRRSPAIKRIFFQPELHMDGALQARALEYLRDSFPGARIALLDWFAPLHIRYATAAVPYIDVYIKKQIFRNFDHFLLPTVGDTNLNDFYAKRHQLPDAPMQFEAPPGMESKMRLGSNFGLSPQMVDLFLGPPPVMEGRDIDLHARIAATGVEWYARMRQESKDAVARLQGLKIASEGRVKRRKFFAEMQRSKICFSPFGYGEVCWRDYEAFATGAILLKPDMSHLVVTPDVFVNGRTYIPLRWDLADFEETVRDTLGNFGATGPMRLEAFDVMRRWILSEDAAREIAALC